MGGTLLMAGKVILITGSTDGLGREVARRLGATGAHIIVHGRNRERGNGVRASIDLFSKFAARAEDAKGAVLASYDNSAFACGEGGCCSRGLQ